MAVGSQRYADAGMAQHFLNDPGMYPFGHKQGSARMPKVMEPNVGQTGPLDQGAVVPAHEVRLMYGGPRPGRKDQARPVPSLCSLSI